MGGFIPPPSTVKGGGFPVNLIGDWLSLFGRRMMSVVSKWRDFALTMDGATGACCHQAAWSASDMTSQETNLNFRGPAETVPDWGGITEVVSVAFYTGPFLG
jgi:hypothetical protein